MMKKKKIIVSAITVLFVILAGTAIFLNSLLPIITGYAAKNLCSDVFVSGRDPESIESTDLNFSFIKYTKNIVDFNEKSVISRFLWGRSKAIYRDGFGATLIREIPEEVLRKAVYPLNSEPDYKKDTTAWPLGDVLPDSIQSDINIPALNSISDKFMNGHAYNGNPFAFLVLHKGIPVVEAYKDQFNRNTRFLSWSLAKSFTNGIVGALVKTGKMDISKPVDIEQWKSDDRSKITLNDLLQMQSGLKWNEDYGSRSDVNIMLFSEGSMSSYAASRPSEYPAGTHWYYSSGTGNIVSHLIRQQFKSDTAYYAFVRDKFFEKIGITDAVFETDPSGELICSSYLYATARDYARFGLLYMNDGIFNNERILPEGWVSYSSTPASDSKGEYGAMFWLNRSGKYPSAPPDMYSGEGHDGQIVFIIPSKELVVVVLGYSPKPDHQIDFDRLLKDVLGTI